MGIALTLAAAFAGAVCTWPVVYNLRRKQREELANSDAQYKSLYDAATHNERLLDHSGAELARLAEVETRYNRLKARLKEVGVTETYVQPVLLVGPSGVGKTSLLTCWQKPWSSTPNSATMRHTFADVPIASKDNYTTRHHFADPDIETPVHVQLVARVHDFPGELRAQDLIQRIVQKETEEVQQSTGNRAGIVLVCMFDATEAVTRISDHTRLYYTGELFRRLRALTARGDAALSRLVLVFNKVDEALAKSPVPLTDAQLRERCYKSFLQSFPEFEWVCHRERIRGVLTMLDNRSPDRVRGASAVFGECTHDLSDVFSVGDTETEFGAPIPDDLLRTGTL